VSISKNGIPITSLEEWLKHAGPKSKHHWQDGRSAKEAARSWLGVSSPDLPEEVATVLSSRKEFGPVRDWVCEPEAKLRFDKFAGEPRNTDLLVVAADRNGQYLIAVEAKADEAFGETVADAIESAIERKLDNPRSNGVARIEQLAAAVLGAKQSGEPSIGKLRYQLLTAIAGAIAAALHKKVNRVVLLVQEFHTTKTDDVKHTKNAHDLHTFVARLSHGRVIAMDPGQLYGPFTIPGKPLFDACPDLYIGRTVCNLRR
jgi:hypothetical protein